MIDLISNHPIIATFLVILFGLWIASKIITKSSPPVEEISGDFTIKDLNLYDGIQRPQTFLALKGIIFDVSGSWFYKKNAPYGKYAGHDASLNLAKMSHDESLLDNWPCGSLTEKENKSLEDWFSKISKKYRQVGIVLGNDKQE